MASPPIVDDPNHSARRAKTRIAVAAVLLTVAIGGLTLLSRQQPAEKSETPVTQKQESISSEENPVRDQEPAPAQISSKEQETPPPPPVETPVTPVAVAPPPPPPQVTNPQPIKNTPAPGTAKASGKISPVPSEPVTPIEKPADKAVATSAPTTEKPVAQKPVVTPMQPASPPATKPGPAPKNYDVQVGVFTDMENAKQLQAKLAEHGIPSHTETKLQVGPFNTKAEADAAREKIKNLGIGSVVVPGK